jgi:hypothetical protein
MLTWQIRLLVDAKIVDPALVPHRPLPANVKASVRKTQLLQFWSFESL